MSVEQPHSAQTGVGEPSRPDMYLVCHRLTHSPYRTFVDNWTTHQKRSKNQSSYIYVIMIFSPDQQDEETMSEWDVKVYKIKPFTIRGTGHTTNTLQRHNGTAKHVQNDNLMHKHHSVDTERRRLNNRLTD